MKIIKYNEGVEVHFKQEGKKSNNEISIFNCIIPSKSRTPMPHYHADFDETVFGVKGKISWTVAGKTTEIGPGESILIPRGVTHSFSNNTDETVEFRCHVSPGILNSDYFEDIAEVINVDGIPDFDHLQIVMRKHGLVPVLGAKRKVIFFILGIVRKFKG